MSRTRVTPKIIEIKSVIQKKSHKIILESFTANHSMVGIVL